MKIIEIGKKKYNLCQNLFDINDERFLVFRQYILQVFENMNAPAFELTYEKCKSLYNANEVWQVPIELENYRKAIQLKELNYDALSICFAIIALEEGENQRETSEAKLLVKLEEMRKNGLNRGLVEESVMGFMKASPVTLGVYSGMLQTLIQNQTEDN